MSVMEGVGARFGRSSTRYGGPATVFTGPVRRWRKTWVHVPPPNSNHHHNAAANGNVNGSNGSSHLQLYKWTPMALSQLRDGSENDNVGDYGNADPKNLSKDDGVAAEQPLKKRFKYIPIVTFKDPKNESSEQMEDERKPSDGNLTATEATSSPDDEKPDMNDVPMDENKDKQSNIAERQDLNESTLDLSLGLKARDNQNESDQNSRSKQR